MVLLGQTECQRVWGLSGVSSLLTMRPCSVLGCVLCCCAVSIQKVLVLCRGVSEECRHQAVCISAPPHPLCSQIKLTPEDLWKTSLQCTVVVPHTIRIENVIVCASMTHISETAGDWMTRTVLPFALRVQKKKKKGWSGLCKKQFHKQFAESCVCFIWTRGAGNSSCTLTVDLVHTS